MINKRNRQQENKQENYKRERKAKKVTMFLELRVFACLHNQYFLLQKVHLLAFLVDMVMLDL